MFWNVEPQRGENILYALQYLLVDWQILDFMTWFADAFVFVWPVMLVVLYVSGMAFNRRDLKLGAVWIFLSAVFAAIVNIVIQLFSTKQRPDQVLDLWFSKKEDLLLYDFLPQGSFPSDHASVAFAIATATLVWGVYRKKPTFVWLAVFLYIGAGVMSIARVWIGIHWPTDVLAGLAIGLFIGCIMLVGRVRVEKLASWLVGIEEKIIGMFK